MLGGWVVVLAMVVLAAVVSCTGPRVEAVEREIDQTAGQVDGARERLADAEPGSAEAQAIRDELRALQVRLLELQKERAQALTQDTRKGVESLLWDVAELLLVGGGVGYGVNRYRTRTRARDLAEIDARLYALEEKQVPA